MLFFFRIYKYIIWTWNYVVYGNYKLNKDILGFHMHLTTFNLGDTLISELSNNSSFAEAS